MKKHIHRFIKFSKTIGKGLKIEMRETIEIPLLIRRKEYKKVGYQVIDIIKMTGLIVIWILPGGAVVTAIIFKFSNRARPSAFQPSKEISDSLLSESCKDNTKEL